MSNRYLRPPQPDPDVPSHRHSRRDEILAFVEWARLFHGLEPQMTDDRIAEIVEGMLAGDAAPREYKVGAAVCIVASAATKQVRQAGRRADYSRTAAAFPKLQFRSMEHSRCAAAEVMQDAVFSVTDAPLLPLPGCDLDNCLCDWRPQRPPRQPRA